MKNRLFALLALLVALSFAGCGSGSESLDTSLAAASSVDDPFDVDADVETLGTYTHGDASVPTDENGDAIPYEYNGGTMEVNYFFSGTGIGKKQGFLLFLDGIPQPWKLNGEGDASYIQYLEAEGDDIPCNFTTSFTPVTGSSGDTLNMTFCSITNAQFQPDMVSTSQFGYYHELLDCTRELHFNADPGGGGEEGTVTEALTSAAVENVKMTSDFEENRLHGSYANSGATTDEILSSGTYSFQLFDGETVYDELDVTGRSTINMTTQITGISGNTYRVTLYANHQPLSDGTNHCWEVTLEKGEVSTVEAVLDLSKIDDFTTVYAIAVPVTGSDDTELTQKTSSVLLHR